MVHAFSLFTCFQDTHDQIFAGLSPIDYVLIMVHSEVAWCSVITSIPSYVSGGHNLLPLRISEF
jgi:hypothetical protein